MEKQRRNGLKQAEMRKDKNKTTTLIKKREEERKIKSTEGK